MGGTPCDRALSTSESQVHDLTGWPTRPSVLSDARGVEASNNQGPRPRRAPATDVHEDLIDEIVELGVDPLAAGTTRRWSAITRGSIPVVLAEVALRPVCTLRLPTRQPELERRSERVGDSQVLTTFLALGRGGSRRLRPRAGLRPLATASPPGERVAFGRRVRTLPRNVASPPGNH